MRQSAAGGAATEARQGPQPKVITPKAVVAPKTKSPGNPPIALEGYCAVTLVEKRVWQAGDKKWGAIHRGHTYLFASEEGQKAFLENPDHYTPVLSGNDPVLRLDQNQDVAGKREHGAFYDDRIYLFASEETFQQFNRDPSRYTVDTRQALRR
jgi:protein disulfide-isomerase